MPFQTLTAKQRLFGFFLASWLGVLLARGFLPLTNSFFGWLETYLSVDPQVSSLIRYACFPLLTLSLYLSLPGKRLPPRQKEGGRAWSFLGAILVSFVAGISDSGPYTDIRNLHAAFWLLFCVPIGEELIFRGWLFQMMERLWPYRFFTASNPLSAATTLSAISFSLWHLQNASLSQTSGLLAQLAWTFYAGLWLGHLRATTGKLWPCVLAHFSINLVYGIPW